MTTNFNFADTYPPIADRDALKALPHNVVIRDEGGFIYEADYTDGDVAPWFIPGIEDPVNHDDVDLPAQVLYSPDVYSWAGIYAREDLERAFDEGYEHGWERCANGDRSDPDNPYVEG